MHRGHLLALTVAGALGLWTTSAVAQPTEPPAASDDEQAPADPEVPEPEGTPSDAESGEPSDAPADAPAAEPAETGTVPITPPQGQVPPSTSAGSTGLGGLGLMPTPSADAAALEGQTPAKEKQVETPASRHRDVFAEDWWSHARPVFEIHGYFRTRAELFHNFSLGRIDAPNSAIWPQPADNLYNGVNETFGQDRLCTLSEAGGGDNDNPASGLYGCRNKTQAGANLRFRLNPELHISDNLRVMSQIDILDNQVLGSTPSGASFVPNSGGGYEVVQRNGYNAAGVYDDTIVPPGSGINSVEDSIRVKRAWGEYTTPVGELRFGRMPNQWGLGMLFNSGDGYDDDYQSTIDRIMFLSGLKPLDLYIGGTWDFPGEGPTRQVYPGGPSYDVAQLDDVNQWSLILMRKKSQELEKMSLSRGDIVLNGGLYLLYRKQLLADDQNGAGADAATGANVPGTTPQQLTNNGFSRRDANIWTPDLWVQFKYKKFRFEAEGAAVLGSIESLQTNGTADFTSTPKQYLRQFGLTTQLQQLLIEDKLSLDFGFGWASGDPDAYDGSNVGDLTPGPNQVQVNDNTDSTFRFHPNYRVDLILHRYLLSRVEGTYYFNPQVTYDFMRKPGGQRLGGGAGFVWSRASQFVQTPGHATDLGIELNGKVYFQTKDGSLNDRPGMMGGFFTMVQYGVLFPLAGLGYQDSLSNRSTSAAQILRWYLGIIF